MNIWRFHIISIIINQVWFKSDFNFRIESYNLISDDIWPWYMTSECMNIEGSHIISINQVWFESDFNFSNEAIFSLSYNLTSNDPWPWYMTFDLINKWGFPCWIYQQTLVEIHQSLWKIEPNVNPFSQQTTTTSKDNNRGQSDPFVSFLLWRTIQ